MSIPPDLLRHSAMNHLSPQNIITMNSPHLFPPQQQQPAQQQQPPSHLGLLSNSANSPLGILTSVPPGSNGPSNQAMYQLQYQQANHQRRQQQLHQQTHPVQGLNPQNNPGTPHVNGLNHPQLQGMPFPNSMIQPSSLRRVPSQTSILAQSAPHIGMHPNQPVVGAVAPMGGMSMTPPSSMASQQLRQVQHQQLRLPQHQQSLPMQGQPHLAPELAMSLNRQGPLSGNVGIPTTIARAGPSQNQQLLSGLPHPSPAPQSHTGIIPPSMPSFQNSMISHTQPQPPLGSSPRVSHAQGSMPPTIASAPGISSQPGSSSRVNPDNAMFISFQNPSMAHTIPHNPPRLAPGNAQFTFPPSSTPPAQLGDISQSISTGSVGTSGQGRSGLMTTPAQALEQMNQGNDGFPFSHSISAPPRPPSQHAPSPHFAISSHPSSQPQQVQGSVQPIHSSPRPPEPQASHMQPQQSQRPQSQPQSTRTQSPQQVGASRTPGTSQPPLSMSSASAAPTPRSTTLSGQSPAAPSPPSSFQASSTSSQPAARPPTGASTPIIASSSTGPSQTTEATTVQSTQPLPVIPPQRPMLSNMSFPVGFGQGLMRLLQFSGVLASDTQNKLQLHYWDSLVREYFTPKASLKFTLWKDNQRNEAKPFEIGVPILPRFFLVTSQSGVKSMNLSIDGARERIVSLGHAIVECVQAVWTYRYTNGYTVTLRGPMTAHILVVPNGPANNQAPNQHSSYTLKFDHLQFDANYHDKLIAMDAICAGRAPESPRLTAATSNGAHLPQHTEDEEGRFEEPRLIIERAIIPAEPVNAFGIPQATMRCLELAESVAQMSPLIQFSTENKLGPLDALTQYAKKLREVQSVNPNGILSQQGLGPTGVVGTFDTVNGVPATPPVTLYSGASFPTTTQGPSITTPPTPALVAGEGPSKSAKPPSTSQPQPTTTINPGTAASTPASASTPTASSTPSIPHAALKRKAQGADNSPTPIAASDISHPKRSSRKRPRPGSIGS